MCSWEYDFKLWPNDFVCVKQKRFPSKKHLNNFTTIDNIFVYSLTLHVLEEYIYISSVFSTKIFSVNLIITRLRINAVGRRTKIVY